MSCHAESDGRPRPRSDRWPDRGRLRNDDRSHEAQLQKREEKVGAAQTSVPAERPFSDEGTIMIFPRPGDFATETLTKGLSAAVLGGRDVRPGGARRSGGPGPRARALSVAPQRQGDSALGRPWGDARFLSRRRTLRGVPWAFSGGATG